MEVIRHVKPARAPDHKGEKQPTKRQRLSTPNAKDVRFAKLKRQRLKKERQQLPIYSARSKLIDLIRKHPSLVIVGETGSGKTTQLPQYIYEAGFNSSKCIAVTQPRRVAAITVAKRVAEEVGTPLGVTVGYSIRFDDTTSANTRIKYLTDGMLLREAQLDPLLKKYSCIMLDEAHERTVHTDILFAVAKDAQKQRPDLRIIVMSATLQADRFSKYFNDAPVAYVAGRQFPVEVLFTEEPEPDYIDATMIAVMQIHLSKPVPGDILVFMTGQDEIEMARSMLEEKLPKLPSDAPTLIITPIYAALPPKEQLKVFERTPAGCRKIILATNIAETSITIRGVKYVIDTGVAKVRQYQPKTGLDCLVVVPISKAEAWQRCGRAGREQPGTCLRLYTEEAFEKLAETIVPEILRCNLCSVVLQLKALNIDNILGFDFMDKPPRSSLVRALEHLYALGCLTEKGKLTNLGSCMSSFPLHPMYAKAILSSREYGCTEEVLTVISMQSVESIFFTPVKKREESTTAKRKFASSLGDHLTYLNVYSAWREVKGDSSWCFENFINNRSMKKVVKVRKQLRGITLRLFGRMYEDFDPGSNTLPSLGDNANVDPVAKCLLSGFFLNVARLQPDGTYRTSMDGQQVGIHPSSVLLGKKVPCVIYNELILTAKKYMRDVTAVDVLWLPEICPRFFSVSNDGRPG